MTTQDKHAIDEMPDSVKQEGQKAYERWLANYLQCKQADNTIEAVKAVEIWAESQTLARRGFYRKHRCKEADEVLSAPHWNPNLGFHYFSYVANTDSNGNEYSLEDVNKAEFICINFALDYLDAEYKLLIGAAPITLGKDDNLESSTKTTGKRIKNVGISQMQQALYTFYLQENDYLPKFQKHPLGKQQAMKEHCIILRFNWESYRNRYVKIEHKSKRISLPSFLKDMQVVLPFLREFPKAFEMAEKEINEAYLVNSKPL